MDVKFNKRNIFQRLFGIAMTKTVLTNEQYSLVDNKIIIDLNKVNNLNEKNNAIRIEEKSIPNRILVFKGDDDKIYAFKNVCGHKGRRLDPVPDGNSVQCCSICKQTYTYDSKAIYGPKQEPAEKYDVSVDNNKLIINLK